MLKVGLCFILGFWVSLTMMSSLFADETPGNVPGGQHSIFKLSDSDEQTTIDNERKSIQPSMQAEQEQEKPKLHSETGSRLLNGVDDPELIDESGTGKSYTIDPESGTLLDKTCNEEGSTKKLDGVNVVKPSEGDKHKPEATKKKPAAVKVFMGTWDESYRNEKKTADYTFSYYGVNWGLLHLRFDTFNYDRRRYWFTYGKVPIAKSPDFIMSYSPGIMINNLYQGKVKRDSFYMGGFVNLQLPRIGISVLDKSYGSTDGDFHHTFVDLKLAKCLDLSLFNYSSIKSIPDTYLGPKLKLNAGKDASFNIWYGYSLVPQKPQARLLNISGSFTF